MKHFYSISIKSLLILLCFLHMDRLMAQEEEILKKAGPDSTVTELVDLNTGEVKKEFVYSPRTAAIRSAVLPGLGQIYNKKYWKLPIVYGALGVSGGVFLYNLKWYRRTRFAVRLLADPSIGVAEDVHPDIRFLFDRQESTTLAYIRDEYRRNIDYSAIVFVLLWGLNVVDATVDAHLKSFDVSPDLSMRFKPGFSDLAGTAGLSIVFDIGKKKPVFLQHQF